MRDLTALRTDWTVAVANGLKPDPTALRAHLKAVHKAHTGFTERCAKRCTDPEGRTTYEWLSQAVRPEKDSTVLDLACGSGPLLELCHQRFGPDLSLIGVDMSEDELALAQVRLPVGRADLHEGQAAAMTAVADNSVDVVLCHWALTLMDPVLPVLQEVDRVLKPGGRFAAIVDGPFDLAPSYVRVNDVVFDHVQQELPGYGTIDLGDPRVRDSSTLLALVREVFPGADVSAEGSVVSMEGDRDSVAKEAAGFFYASFVLSTTRRQAMLSELAKTLEEGAFGGLHDGPSTKRFSMPVNRIVVDVPLLKNTP